MLVDHFFERPVINNFGGVSIALYTFGEIGNMLELFFLRSFYLCHFAQISDVFLQFAEGIL